MAVPEGVDLRREVRYVEEVAEKFLLHPGLAVPRADAAQGLPPRPGQGEQRGGVTPDTEKPEMQGAVPRVYGLVEIVDIHGPALPRIKRYRILYSFSPTKESLFL